VTIRIDEIYNNTFWPWIQRHRPDLRIFYCDPFGRSDPDSVIGHALEQERRDTNYVFFFDQEPVHEDLHRATFDQVRYYNNGDIHDPTWHENERNSPRPAQLGHLVTSEYRSEAVERICKHYGWRSHYYWFHGWAALDWYRGYNRTYLMTAPEERRITRTFVAPNRIAGGRRAHRLEVLYWIFRYDLLDNYISCPAQCPAENQAVMELIQPLKSRYPDITAVFDQVKLPLNMPGESGHPMTSCWLDLWQPLSESLLYLVTETVATGRRQHLTEKIFKPIAQAMPFVLVGTQGALAYLRKYGFRTFNTVWDEGYDDVADDHERIACIGRLLRDLDQLSLPQKQELFEQCRPIVEHNYNHFYSGAFETVLWQEMTAMLEQLKQND
jgi:hypothetical protein